MDIIDWLRPGIVAVLKPNGKPNGTGFLVTSDGHILTCYHVLQPALKSLSTIRIQSQGDIFDAELVEELSRSDNDLDFAVLKVQVDRKFPCLPLGTEGVQGHHWCTLGFELAERYYGVPNDGTIKGYTPRGDDLTLRDIILHSDNPILGGLSGSPVFNTKTGRVVGIIKEEMVNTQGHATSIEAIFRIWPELERLNSQSELLMHVPEKKKISDKTAIHIPYTRNANFTGRDTLLADLRKALQSGDKVAQTHVKALTGLGGIGKTQLALEYSYRYQDDYDIVWWLRSELFSTLLDDYARMVVNLKLPGWDDSGDLNLMADLAKSFLETHSRWLLVFDNAKDPQDVKPYLPHGGGGHVIITSRNPIWGNLARSMAVSKFERSESIEFLCNRTDQEDRKAAGELADALGDLPLALEQAGAYMETRAKPLGEYLKAFQERRLVILAKSIPSDYPKTVATTWNISFKAVHAEYPEAIGFLQLFSYLAPDDIPLAYLIKGSGFLPNIIASILRDEDGREEALAALRRYSLISINGDRISVHRLVQAITRDNLVLQEQKEWAEAAVKLLNDAFPKDLHDSVQAWAECALLLPHSLMAAENAYRLKVAPESTGHILRRIGQYFIIRAEFDKAKETLSRALSIDREIYGFNNLNVAEDEYYFGSALHFMGDLNGAKKHYEIALEIGKKICGSENPISAKYFNKLGTVQIDVGQLDEALKYLMKALDIYRKSVGCDDPKVAVVLNNIGRVKSKKNDKKRAKEYYQMALEIYEREFGLDNRKVAVQLNNLGHILKAENDLEGARKNFQRALEIDEKVYNFVHPYVARDVKNLGMVLQAQGDIQEARKCYEKALKIFQNCLGEEHPYTRAVRGNLESISHT
jgi:tetratricopeptide (TPR) repeat protein